MSRQQVNHTDTPDSEVTLGPFTFRRTGRVVCVTEFYMPIGRDTAQGAPGLEIGTLPENLRPDRVEVGLILDSNLNPQASLIIYPQGQVMARCDSRSIPGTERVNLASFAYMTKGTI